MRNERFKFLDDFNKNESKLIFRSRQHYRGDLPEDYTMTFTHARARNTKSNFSFHKGVPHEYISASNCRAQESRSAYFSSDDQKIDDPYVVELSTPLFDGERLYRRLHQPEASHNFIWFYVTESSPIEETARVENGLILFKNKGLYFVRGGEKVTTDNLISNNKEVLEYLLGNYKPYSFLDSIEFNYLMRMVTSILFVEHSLRNMFEITFSAAMAKGCKYIVLNCDDTYGLHAWKIKENRERFFKCLNEVAGSFSNLNIIVQFYKYSWSDSEKEECERIFSENPRINVLAFWTKRASLPEFIASSGHVCARHRLNGEIHLSREDKINAIPLDWSFFEDKIDKMPAIRNSYGFYLSIIDTLIERENQLKKLVFRIGKVVKMQRINPASLPYYYISNKKYFEQLFKNFHQLFVSKKTNRMVNYIKKHGFTKTLAARLKESIIEDRDYVLETDSLVAITKSDPTNTKEEKKESNTPQKLENKEVEDNSISYNDKDKARIVHILKLMNKFKEKELKNITYSETDKEKNIARIEHILNYLLNIKILNVSTTKSRQYLLILTGILNYLIDSFNLMQPMTQFEFFRPKDEFVLSIIYGLFGDLQILVKPVKELRKKILKLIETNKSLENYMIPFILESNQNEKNLELYTRQILEGKLFDEKNRHCPQELSMLIRDRVEDVLYKISLFQMEQQFSPVCKLFSRIGRDLSQILEDVINDDKSSMPLRAEKFLFLLEILNYLTDGIESRKWVTRYTLFSSQVEKGLWRLSDVSSLVCHTIDNTKFADLIQGLVSEGKTIGHHLKNTQEALRRNKPRGSLRTISATSNP